MILGHADTDEVIAHRFGALTAEAQVEGIATLIVRVSGDLETLLEPAEVRPIDDLGIPAEAKEAVDFAILARETLLVRKNVLSSATGASKEMVLVTIALGSNL